MLGPTVLDSITLTSEEWSTLAPIKTDVGSQSAVPEATARKFFPLLSTSDTTFRDSREVTSVRITSRVAKVANGKAYLTLEGTIAATHHGTPSEGKAGNKCSAEAKLIGGVAAYDVKTRKMLTLTLVFDGLFRNYAPYDEPPARFGAVVEWRRERPDKP